MGIRIFQVDAFTRELFKGNPAAVCVLDTWPSDALLQSIAAENNLSETAFCVREGEHWRLRWFTPAVEVDLCGHATLASAHVLFSHFVQSADRVVFETRSGRLRVARAGDRLVMDFPAFTPQPCTPEPGLVEAVGGRPIQVLAAWAYVLVYGSEAEVRALAPDMKFLSGIERDGVVVTAPGREVDFVSRYFVPSAGIPEDPVTGSTHCILAPYWADRLGKTELEARQVSSRSGEIGCRVRGDRVELVGACRSYMVGEIEVPSTARIGDTATRS